jgi:hypothetical protein
MFKGFVEIGSLSVQKIHNEHYLNIHYYVVIRHSLQEKVCDTSNYRSRVCNYRRNEKPDHVSETKP